MCSVEARPSSTMCLALKMFAVLGAFSITAGVRLHEYETCIRPKLTIPGTVQDGNWLYLRKGYPMEIYCSGDSKQLKIYKASELLHSDIINSTTVRAIIEKPTRMYLRCHSGFACGFDSKSVRFEWYPEITQFNCYSKHLQLMNCSWSVPLSDSNYTVSYTHSGGETVSQACRGLTYSRENFCCVWDMNNIDMADETLFILPVHLQLCNIFGCVKETREVDIIAATKLDPPTDLSIHRISSREIMLDWRVEFRLDMRQLVSSLELYYTVDYWFPGIQPRVVISNTTDAHGGLDILNLPCPDKQYTIRVSCRPTTAPPEYMSGFATISFYTEIDSEATLDPICQIEPMEENSAVMIYKNHLLKNHVHEELKKYNKRVNSLRKKALRIKELRLSLE